MTFGKLVSLRRSQGEAASLSDEALLAATATGDLAALDALFERFHVTVYRFLGRLAAADEAARDDLVQATFLEARRGARRFRGGSSVKTWILGIAANLARHHLRGERRRREKHARYAEGLHVVSERPDERLERREILREIEDALARLPHDLRVAFVMCDLEDISGVDAARVVGVPQGTLWRRLHVARKAVRAAVEEATR
jgi:RNA polymerase sigma-70 factor (ECF subfamily)